MSERIYEETNSGKIIPKERIVRCYECEFKGEVNCPQYYRRNELKDTDFCSDGESTIAGARRDSFRVDDMKSYMTGYRDGLKDAESAIHDKLRSL